MSAFCWQTLQKSLSKSVRFENTDEISTWLMLFFHETEITKNGVFNSPPQTNTQRGSDRHVFDLFDLILFSDRNLTLLNLSVYSAYYNQNTLNWLHMMGLLSHLHWHKTSWPAMLKWYNSIMLCWIKQQNLIICDLAEYFMRYFQPHRRSVKCHCTDLVTVSRFFV